MEVLSAKEMYLADRLTIEAGTPGITLMENAGAVTVEEIEKRFVPCPTLVLCGTGNNGGDGFVIARLLKAKGWDVYVQLVGDASAIKGDTKIAYDRWNNGENKANKPALCIDALFGVGLTRLVAGIHKEAINKISALHVPVVAVDIPSGIHADTGEIMGAALKAILTVTFFRSKYGHHIEPGKTYRGELVVRDIGIPASVMKVVKPRTRLDSGGKLVKVSS